MRQAFQKSLNFVFQHARHQPFGAVFADLVEHKQRHSHGDAVFGVAGLVQIAGLAIGAAQAQYFRKRLRSDAHGFMAHQGLAGHQQRLACIPCCRAATQFIAVPALQRLAAAHILGQMLLVKRLNHGLVDQHILAARLVLQLHHLRDEFFISSHKSQRGLPLRLYQRFANKDLPRQHRISLGEWHASAAVDHQAIQRGSLKRHHIAMPRFPVRVQQLFFQQMFAHLL